MFVIRLFWGTIDFHSRENNTMEANGAPELLCFPHSSKYLPLCSAEHSYIHTGLELLEGDLMMTEFSFLGELSL